MLSTVFTQSLSAALCCLQTFVQDTATQDVLVELSQRICDCYRAGGKVLVAGNGGSMANAMHFAEELTGRFRDERPPLPAMALADPAHLSCVSNDYGFECVFSRMIEAFARPGDIVILLSTSGNSDNLILAAQKAQEQQVFVAGFLGRGGGRLAPLCNLFIIAPGETADRIQEIHTLSLHILIESIELGLGLAQQA